MPVALPHNESAVGCQHDRAVFGKLADRSRRENRVVGAVRLIAVGLLRDNRRYIVVRVFLNFDDDEHDDVLLNTAHKR